MYGLVMLPLLLAVVYGTIAVIVLIRRQLQFKQGRHADVDPRYLDRAARGTTVPQMFSFVLSLGLLMMVFLMLCVGLLSAVNYTDDLVGFVIFGSLFLLIPLTPLTIIVNCFWIYSNRILYGEARATSALVKIQRVSAWVAWGIFLLAGWAIIISAGLSALQSAAQMNDLIGY